MPSPSNPNALVPELELRVTDEIGVEPLLTTPTVTSSLLSYGPKPVVETVAVPPDANVISKLQPVPDESVPPWPDVVGQIAAPKTELAVSRPPARNKWVSFIFIIGVALRELL